MKLISDEKVHSEVEKYANKSSLEWISFVNGAHFAEAELQNLAIEFADWKDSNCTKQRSDIHGGFWSVNGGTAMYFHNRELFMVFMEQRNR